MTIIMIIIILQHLRDVESFRYYYFYCYYYSSQQKRETENDEPLSPNIVTDGNGEISFRDPARER